MLYPRNRDEDMIVFDPNSGQIINKADGTIIGEVVIPLDPAKAKEYNIRSPKQYAQRFFDDEVRANNYSINFHTQLSPDAKARIFDLVFRSYHPIASKFQSISGAINNILGYLNTDLIPLADTTRKLINSINKTLEEMPDDSIKKLLGINLTTTGYSILESVLSPFSDIEKVEPDIVKMKQMKLRMLESHNSALQTAVDIGSTYGLLSLAFIGSFAVGGGIGALLKANKLGGLLGASLAGISGALYSKTDFIAQHQSTLPEPLLEEYANNYALGNFFINTISMRLGASYALMQQAMKREISKFGLKAIRDNLPKVISIIGRDYGINLVSNIADLGIYTWTPADMVDGYLPLIKQASITAGIGTAVGEIGTIVPLLKHMSGLNRTVHNNKVPSPDDLNLPLNTNNQPFPDGNNIAFDFEENRYIATNPPERYWTYYDNNLEREEKAFNHILNNDQLLKEYNDELALKGIQPITKDNANEMFPYITLSTSIDIAPSVFIGRKLEYDMPISVDYIENGQLSVQKLSQTDFIDQIDYMLAKTEKGYLGIGNTPNERVVKYINSTNTPLEHLKIEAILVSKKHNREFARKYAPTIEIVSSRTTDGGIDYTDLFTNPIVEEKIVEISNIIDSFVFNNKIPTDIAIGLQGELHGVGIANVVNKFDEIADRLISHIPKQRNQELNIVRDLATFYKKGEFDYRNYSGVSRKLYADFKLAILDSIQGVDPTEDIANAVIALNKKLDQVPLELKNSKLIGDMFRKALEKNIEVPSRFDSPRELLNSVLEHAKIGADTDTVNRLTEIQKTIGDDLNFCIISP